jgi:hypothetical protein
MSNSTPIDQLIDRLPTEGLTVRALGLLDTFVPGQWQNVTGFDNLIRQVTGETDAAMIAAVRRRALELYADPNQGYQRAVWIYQMIDATDSKLGMAAMANKVGESFSFLSFLSKVTPKADTAQTIDLAVKLIGEVVAFCYANGFPGDSIRDFLAALTSYQKENLIRVAALVTYDGLLPLGPDYGVKLIDKVHTLSAPDLESNATFQRIRGMIPGGNVTQQAMGFLNQATDGMGQYVGNFTSRHGITVPGVLGGLRRFMDASDGKLDVVAAVIDMSTNYMEHTGIQSVGRSLIERAVGEV